MRPLRRPQSLPLNMLEASTHIKGCVVQDFEEELYNQPIAVERRERCMVEKGPSSSSSLGECYNQEIVSPLSQCSTKSIPIPSPPHSREEEREVELYQEMMHVYDDATWKMYNRIQNARKARHVYERKRSRSEGYRSDDNDW